jgi:hypothetical protein
MMREAYSATNKLAYAWTSRDEGLVPTFVHLHESGQDAEGHAEGHAYSLSSSVAADLPCEWYVISSIARLKAMKVMKVMQAMMPVQTHDGTHLFDDR